MYGGFKACGVWEFRFKVSRGFFGRKDIVLMGLESNGSEGWGWAAGDSGGRQGNWGV